MPDAIWDMVQDFKDKKNAVIWHTQSHFRQSDSPDFLAMLRDLGHVQHTTLLGGLQIEKKHLLLTKVMEESAEPSDTHTDNLLNSTIPDRRFRWEKGQPPRMITHHSEVKTSEWKERHLKWTPSPNSKPPKQMQNPKNTGWLLLRLQNAPNTSMQTHEQKLNKNWWGKQSTNQSTLTFMLFLILSPPHTQEMIS